MNDITKIVKSFEESSVLIKRTGEKIKNETKERKRWFYRTLLSTLGANLLRNLLRSKRTNKAGQAATAKNPSCKANMPGWGTIKAGQDF